ncbi:hypothetical protein ACOMHN_051587 [Nucella lapillus]
MYFLCNDTLTAVYRYQNTWLWSDNTLAVYLPLTFSQVAAPYCGALRGSNFTLVSCKQNLQAAFLCEMSKAGGEAGRGTGGTAVSMPSPSSWGLDNMTSCRHNHTAHTFLACDVTTNCSVASQEEIPKCINAFSPPVPFFTCRNQMGRVPYSLVCDFRSDCCDGSDEDFCHFPACDSKTEYECADGKQVSSLPSVFQLTSTFFSFKTEYQCADGKQCVPRQAVCDGPSDCVDSSDELKCWDDLTSEELFSNTVAPPARVDFTGTGAFNVTPLPGNTCPHTHFQCPGGGYCLPVYVRCNGVNDCPGKEDEMSCDHYTCPGFYRCRRSPICVHRQHLCDGVFQCPQHDDEWLCNVTCPDTCHCYGHAFICTAGFTPSHYPELRFADASGTGMNPEDFYNNTKLIHLSVKRCGISMLKDLNFPNLHSLDLSFNNIEKLHRDQFLLLNNLISLSLAYNMFLSLDSLLYSGLKCSNVINVDISGIAIPELSEEIFKSFSNVEYLNLSSTGLTKLSPSGFQSLKKLRLLDVRGCPMKTFSPGVFDGLRKLDFVYADNYKLCCLADLPEGMDSDHCYAPPDEISSCDALLKADVFRVFLAMYAILTLLGNAGTFVYRVCVEGRGPAEGYEVLVTHLSVSDLLMGVYLAIVGVADRVYYGDYRWHDGAWKHSVACKMAGFLSLVSSEVSAFLISLITLERLLVIGFPHNSLRFNRLSAHAASLAVWLVGLLLALVPLLPVTSHWELYSQSGICAPLPVSNQPPGGEDYTFSIMTILNFVLFLFIAVGQILIYCSIRMNAVDSNGNGRESRDTAIARRLLAVVTTDFLCWFPIGVAGIAARCDVPIPSQVVVAISIFVLPFNAALNPFLYTLSVVMERRQSAKYEKEMASSQIPSRALDSASDSRKKASDVTEEEAFQMFIKFLQDGLLTPQQIRKQVWEIPDGQ